MNFARSATTSLTLLLGAVSGAAADGHGVTREGERIRLRAGSLERTLHAAGNRLLLEGLSVGGSPLVEGGGGEVSFRLSLASPNRDPLEFLTADGGGIDVEAGEEGGTDALKVRAKGGESASPGIVWTDGRSFAGNSWQECFDLTRVAVTTPRSGVERVTVRSRSLRDPVLAGVSVSQIYEIYDGYPVIRKWVEFQNNGANWLRLDKLVIDDLRLLSGFLERTPLTPSERGAGSSMIAFSNREQTRGIIVASEIPSALRRIGDGGSSGYAPEHFEWVLGPGERFVSEPTFLYAFDGEVFDTPSARSLPLDRAVESGFKRFLREHVGVAADATEIPAPQWASWTNFGHEITGEIAREQADLAARCGFVLFELDDGWQRGRLGVEPDPEKFPEMDELASHVRSLDLRLGLWVSSFRLRDEKDFRALPDAAVSPEVGRSGGVAMGFSGPWRRYYANDLLDLHDRYGATYFKQDFTNIKFGDLGAGSPARTRKESVLRGLRGLLEAQDILRRGAPEVSNEITHEIYWGTPGVPADLAAVKHAAIYHIPPNDYSGVGHWKQEAGSPGWERYDPKDLRQQLVAGCFNARQRFYAHRGLPLECLEYFAAATVNWKGSLTPQVQDRQLVSWLMGAPLLFSGDLSSLTEENIARYRQRFGMVAQLEERYGIYRCFQYSGVPAPTDTGWHWWGKLNEAGHGAVVVVRGSAGEDERSINVPWVAGDRRYRVTARFQDKELGTLTGRQLQEGRLVLRLPSLGQEILELSPVFSASPGRHGQARP